MERRAPVAVACRRLGAELEQERHAGRAPAQARQLQRAHLVRVRVRVRVRVGVRVRVTLDGGWCEVTLGIWTLFDLRAKRL